MTDKLRFEIQPWEGTDKILTVNGQPVGPVMGRKQLRYVKRWLYNGGAESLIRAALKEEDT